MSVYVLCYVCSSALSIKKIKRDQRRRRSLTRWATQCAPEAMPDQKEWRSRHSPLHRTPISQSVRWRTRLRCTRTSTSRRPRCKPGRFGNTSRDTTTALPRCTSSFLRQRHGTATRGPPRPRYRMSLPGRRRGRRRRSKRRKSERFWWFRPWSERSELPGKLAGGIGVENWKLRI